MTIKSCASAFIAGTAARCHNVETDGTSYILHGSRIAWREPDGTIHASFCDRPTRTTKNHLAAIATAAGSQRALIYSATNDPFILWSSK